MMRTHNCGELNSKETSEKVKLIGWIARKRDHGGISFLDLRDKHGITQIVLDPKKIKEIPALGREFVVLVKGIVSKRPKGTENKKLTTGEIEVIAEEIKVLSESKPIPFELDDKNVSEEIKMKYRYLDLRSKNMQENILFRHKLVKTVRDYLNAQDFLEIETPILMKSTPEGARDYLVPSRLHKGKFYALPQSPQMYKQLLMIAGYEKYYQIARCFRDEDLRADRQPEFTQLDLEMSFVEQEDIFEVIEQVIKAIFEKVIRRKIKTPFPRYTYKEIIEKYGIDRPDLRFGLELKDLSEVFKETEFKAFKEVIEFGGIIKGINVKKGSSLGKKDLNDLIETAKVYGAKGLITIKAEENLESMILKYLKEKEINELKKMMQTEKGDLILIIADKPKIVNDSLGFLRNEIAKKMNLLKGKENEFNFLWVVDFPLFSWDEEERKFQSEHHPFTGFKEEDYHLLDSNKLNEIRSTSYDLVMNGIELGSGSIRIHDNKVQKKIFEVLGLSEEEIKRKFGFFIEALEYGTPPHGGIALGLDRLIMLLSGKESIREVIAFVKNKDAMSLMSGCPSFVDEKQLKELHLILEEPPEEK